MTKQVMTMKSGGGISAIIPQSIEEVYRLAGLCVKSGMAPKSFNGNAEAVTVAILTGLELGVPPMQALQGIAVINGHPSVWGDLAIALVLGSDVCEYVQEEMNEDGTEAICTVKRKDQTTTHTRKFSLEDAKAAGLLGKQGPWKTYPKRMLQMRARSWALRDVFSDVLKGLRVAEEEQDIVDVSPEKLSPPPAPQIEDKSQDEKPFDEGEYIASIEVAMEDCETEEELKDLLATENENWSGLNEDIVHSIRPLVLELYDDRLKQVSPQLDIEQAIESKKGK